MLSLNFPFYSSPTSISKQGKYISQSIDLGVLEHVQTADCLGWVGASLMWCIQFQIPALYLRQIENET